MNLISDFINSGLGLCYYDYKDIESYSKSNMTYVDGEEGDYGTIEYYSEPSMDSTSLIATRTIYGGDSEDIDYTPFGKQLIIQHIAELLAKKHKVNIKAIKIKND